MNSVVSAFTEAHVERLTSVPVHKLRYWDRTGFFSPSFAAENRRVPFSRIYSFTDVMALRVLFRLNAEHKVPVQHLRQVKTRLVSMDNSAWSRTTLYVLNKRVYFDAPDGGKHDIDGQYAIPIVLKKIMSDVQQDIRSLSARSDTMLGQSAQTRRVSHNAKVIAGTRIPVRTIQEFAEAGYSVDAIMREYPVLNRQDIENILQNQRVA